MNYHQIKELERAIEKIKEEPYNTWVGYMTIKFKIAQIQNKIRSLQKNKDNETN